MNTRYIVHQIDENLWEAVSETRDETTWGCWEITDEARGLTPINALVALRVQEVENE